MPKVDDTNTIPEKITAPWMKRFFKVKFGIPVRVRGCGGRFVDVWIPSDRSNLHELRYDHDFPPELGNRCMRAVYPNSETLREQNWGGNVSAHSIAISDREWRQVLQQCIDDPIEVAVS
jgi:hypothetical protein